MLHTAQAEVRLSFAGLLCFEGEKLGTNHTGCDTFEDGTMQAEEFTAKLQKELNSAPQPYLVPFLKKNLPFLRHSLITKELTIEGVRPPPPGAIILPHPSSLQQIQ
ncbi:transcription initiation factor TFIID subunit 4, partial [Trichonephila clavipes]